MKTTLHPHGLVIPSHVFLAFRLAAVVRMALAPLYVVAGVGKVVEGTLECVFWTLWIRLCETMHIAEMGWLMEGPAAVEDQRIGGLTERDERCQGTVERNGMREVRMMEEGRSAHSHLS